MFRFGTRPLANLKLKSSLSGNNKNAWHENGFYDFGANVGYFKEGIRPDSQKNRTRYKMFGPYYDDFIMRLAEQNLRDSGRWLPDDPNEPWYSNKNPNDYDLTLHNCQDFADALRDEYKRLGGTTRSTPFPYIYPY